MEAGSHNIWVVFLGGDSPRELPSCLRNNTYQGMICADSGANHAFDLRLLPDLIVGDLDSIAPEVARYYSEKGVRLLKFPKEKDYSDGELALIEAAKQGAADLVILGAFGGRIDHELANVFLLAQYTHLFHSLTLWGDGFIAFFCPPAKKITIRGQSGDIVSLMPLSPLVEKVSLEGFLYPLTEEDLPIGTTRGLSNCLGGLEGTVRYEKGSLLIIHYLDGGLPGSEYYTCL